MTDFNGFSRDKGAVLFFLASFMDDGQKNRPLVPPVLPLDKSNKSAYYKV